jgi:20S proteasome alpha/beta subunit
MTLAMALRGCDGLVLATDSRVTKRSIRGSGMEVSTADTSEKFLQINRDTGVMTYGLANPGYQGISRLAQYAKQKPLLYFSDVVEAAERIFDQEFGKWSTKEVKKGRRVDESGLVGFIVGGYSSETNSFEICHWESPEFEIKKYRTFLIAAQWHIARFLINHLWYPEISVKQLIDFAVFVMIETASAEPTVGGPIQLATVTLDRGFQRIPLKDVEEIIQRNQKRFSDFRKILLDVFYEDMHS